MEGRIVKVSGPLIVAENMADVKVYDVVKVGEDELIGEVIELRRDRASIQVYEETSGLGVGDKVVSTGEPLSVELAPGIVGGIYDGIQRPLEQIVEKYGDRITRGLRINKIDREKKWKFVPLKKAGDYVTAGDAIGYVDETAIVRHKILVPYGVSGRIESVEDGEFTVTQTIATVKDGDVIKELSMLTRWPVRKSRPYKEKRSPEMPMVTGQRVIDTLFPIAKGGVAAVPGPFGSGKTVVQHQLAKWADAEIIVYEPGSEFHGKRHARRNDFVADAQPRSFLVYLNGRFVAAKFDNLAYKFFFSDFYDVVHLYVRHIFSHYKRP